MTFQARSACQLSEANIGTANEGKWAIREGTFLVWFDRDTPQENMRHAMFAAAALRGDVSGQPGCDFEVQVLPVSEADPRWAATAGGQGAWVLADLPDGENIIASVHQFKEDVNRTLCEQVAEAWNRAAADRGSSHTQTRARGA